METARSAPVGFGHRGISHSRVSGAIREFLDRAYVVVSLLVFFGVALPTLANPGTTTSVTVDADSASSTARLLVYASFVLLVVRHRVALLHALMRNKVQIALLLFAMSSVAWSNDPATTLRSSVLLAATSLYGLYVGIRFPPRAQLQILSWALGIAIVISLVFVYATPYGIQPGAYDGAWRGAFIHKNTFGKVLGLAVPTLWLTGKYSRRWKFICYLISMFSVLLIFKAHSVGGMSSASASLGIILAIPLLRSPRAPGWLVATLALAAAALFGAAIVFERDFLLSLLGRDPTLSGRTVLWALLVPKIAMHPTLGFGLDAFWHGRTEPYADIWKIVGWMPPHAHNGFVNVTIDLGFVGVTVLTLALMHAFYRAFIYLRSESTAPALEWPLVSAVFLLVSNLMEVSFLQYSNAYWVLFFATCASTAIPPVNNRRTIT